ncbi:MAG: hypothetical protein M3P30_14380 [Chloroflexota bacterium]|nr:hypothetical protein [Chloroflexota bacterium]
MAAPVVVVAAAVAVFVTVGVFVRFPVDEAVVGVLVAAVVAVGDGVGVHVGVHAVAVGVAVAVFVGVLVDVLVDVLVGVLVGTCALAVGAEVRLYAASPATIRAAMPSPSAKRFMVLPSCLVDASESFERWTVSYPGAGSLSTRSTFLLVFAAARCVPLWNVSVATVDACSRAASM